MTKANNKIYLKVFRSNKNIFAQICDGARVLGGCSTLTSVRGKGDINSARKVGQEIKSIAKSKKIDNLIFDRGKYKYHGQVKALNEGYLGKSEKDDK
jgi:large subunit ribosomal protein L18